MKKNQNPNDPHNLEITKMVISWVIEKFNLPADCQVEVLEISCADGCCPNTQTKIIISTPSICQYIVGKPLMYVRKWDIKLLQ